MVKYFLKYLLSISDRPIYKSNLIKQSFLKIFLIFLNKLFVLVVLNLIRKQIKYKNPIYLETYWMKPINLCTLEVRIGKCHLNLKSDGLFGVSLEMGIYFHLFRQICFTNVTKEKNPKPNRTFQHNFKN